MTATWAEERQEGAGSLGEGALKQKEEAGIKIQLDLGSMVMEKCPIYYHCRQTQDSRYRNHEDNGSQHRIQQTNRMLGTLLATQSPLHNTADVYTKKIKEPSPGLKLEAFINRLDPICHLFLRLKVCSTVRS